MAMCLGMGMTAAGQEGAQQGSVRDLGEVDPNMAVEEVQTPGITWHAPGDPPFRLTGFAWFGQDRVFRRLPVQPDPAIPDPVDRLAWQTSGGRVSFRTDATAIVIRVRLRDAAGRMYHMAPTGESGFDLYIGEPGDSRFFTSASFRPGAREYEAQMFSHREARMREFTLNFPLYNGVEDLQIGLPDAARIEPPTAFDAEERVVIYGGSTIQGACASRPGTGHMNIVGRALNREVLNLGFSGSGKLETEVAHVLARIERPGVFLIECERNSGPVILAERLAPFIAILRAAHPRTPIVVLSANPRAREAHGIGIAGRLRNGEIMRDVVGELRSAGDARVYFVDASGWMGEDFHASTVDNSHPTDLGFHRMAEGLLPVLRAVLSGGPPTGGGSPLPSGHP